MCSYRVLEMINYWYDKGQLLSSITNDYTNAQRITIKTTSNFIVRRSYGESTQTIDYIAIGRWQ